MDSGDSPVMVNVGEWGMLRSECGLTPINRPTSQRNMDYFFTLVGQLVSSEGGGTSSTPKSSHHCLSFSFQTVAGLEPTMFERNEA